MKILIGIAIVALLGLALFFAFNTYTYEGKQTEVAAEVSTTTEPAEEAMIYDLGTYGYRCGEGTEFTISLPSDLSSILLTPASDIERVPQAVLVKEESESGAVYKGNSLTFEAHGESVILSTASWDIICLPMTAPDEAPFNWGD